jgi:hypothetical protein
MSQPFLPKNSSGRAATKLLPLCCFGHFGCCLAGCWCKLAANGSAHRAWPREQEDHSSASPLPRVTNHQAPRSSDQGCLPGVNGTKSDVNNHDPGAGGGGSFTD